MVYLLRPVTLPNLRRGNLCSPGYRSSLQRPSTSVLPRLLLTLQQVYFFSQRLDFKQNPREHLDDYPGRDAVFHRPAFFDTRATHAKNSVSVWVFLA